nr:alpha-glucan family phosphorylase [Bryobacter sp.]
MSFQIQPVREFLVRPALPPSLSRLPELAYNLLWSWDHHLRSLFRRLDSSAWRQSHNPVLMLGRLPAGTLEKAAADPRFVSLYRRACERLDAYSPKPATKDGQALIAYFSMEYGLVSCLPIYSGGLGVLSGDHMKAASDANLPLVGVGLLYQRGYHVQRLNQDGWQQELYPVNDFPNMPVRPVLTADGRELKVRIDIPLGTVVVQVWYVEVGRVRLYLLDTNIPENTNPEIRDITDHLYGGDAHTRIRQEIVLGMAGYRALREMGYRPTVFHMNEGHSAFLGLERIRELMLTEKLSFEEAHEAARSNNIFTTHTSVPAGIDLFDPGVLWSYMEPFCREAGITIEQFFSLGRKNTHDASERFSMAIAAMNTASFRNAVSRLHREVSQEMWQGLWPQLPTWEVPITSVTNGVHLPSFLNGDLAGVYDQYLQPDWREHYAEARIWEQIDEIPNHELWEAHLKRKRQLVTFVRERLVEAAQRRRAPATEMKRIEEVFDPEVFTIGFARRFATYKRATLLFKDIERLKALCNAEGRPVQMVIAGKAHPQDHAGKALIRDIVQWSRDPKLRLRLVFLENYDLRVAKELVQGVDLWLNTPRRGEEACGTSGMKAAINGVLNFSVLDGWWDEAFEVSGGWAIGERSVYSEDQEDLHATDIYSLLENEIVPLYYERNERDVPEQWMARVKQCLKALSPQFNSQRMIEEYNTQFYQAAHAAWKAMEKDHFAEARSMVQWKRGVEAAWDRVHFKQLGPAPEFLLTSGKPIPLQVMVDLGGLQPSDVRVEAVIGRVNGDGHLEDTEVL